MRTIRFRGKDEKGNWHYGDLEHSPIGKFCRIHEYRNNGFYQWHADVDPATIGQFTGLHDKNGKEIYEGDVIRINITDGSTTISSVFWNNRRGYWGCDIDINHGVQLGLIDKVRIEVIGNIYDNPELLKGGEQ